MKNALEQFIAEKRMNEAKAMNLLQSAGIVSDNAVMASDVALADLPAARKYLLNFVPCSLCGKIRRLCCC